MICMTSMLWQVLQSLPRLVRDVEAVRAEASRLREQMSVAKADIVKVRAVNLNLDHLYHQVQASEITELSLQ